MEKRTRILAIVTIAGSEIIRLCVRSVTFGDVTGGSTGLNSFAGLARRAPWHAAAMAILMLSLTGIPPTVGFFAKLYVLLAAVEANLAWLAVIIVLNAALGAFYYLRVIVYMYMRDPEDEPASVERSPSGTLALALSVAGVLVLGIFPGAILGLLEVSAASLF